MNSYVQMNYFNIFWEPKHF